MSDRREDYGGRDADRIGPRDDYRDRGYGYRGGYDYGPRYPPPQPVVVVSGPPQRPIVVRRRGIGIIWTIIIILVVIILLAILIGFLARR